MLNRVRVRWFRFTHGEDIFDGWPGEDVERAPHVQRTAASLELQVSQ